MLKMKPALQRYSTTPVTGGGEGEHSGCPVGTKCKYLHNLDVNKDTIREPIQRISSKIFLPGELAQIKESGSEPALSAKRAAHRIHPDKYSGNTLAARTVELYEELVQAEGRHFCSYTLAGLLVNLGRDKPVESEGLSRAHTMPNESLALGHSKHVDMYGGTSEGFSDGEAWGSSTPTSVLGPFRAGSDIQYLKGNTKTGQPHNNVTLVDKDPLGQNVEKWPLKSTEPDAECRTNIVLYVGAGVGAGALILALAAGVLLFNKKLPRHL